MAVSVSAQTPIGMQKWQNDDTTFTMQFGGPLQNYQDTAGVWRSIKNNFINSAGSFVADSALLKTTVDSVGNASVTYTHNGIDYTITQRPYSLTWFRASDSAWTHIDNTPNWNNISHNDNNIVGWGNVYPGVNMWVEKDKGQVDYGIKFKPVFLDSLVALYNQRPDSADMWLANISRFTLSGGIDNHNIPLGTVNKRVLKRWGGFVFQMGRQFLHYPGSDTLPGIPVLQRHIFAGNDLYVLELVKASKLKRIHLLYPNVALWHNTDFTLDNDTDIEDATLHGNNGDYNDGNGWLITTYGVFSYNYSIIARASTAINDSLGTGATISSASIWVYEVYGTTAADIDVYGMWKTDWVEDDTSHTEGGATHNDWESPNNEWATAGCNCAGDDGSFNSHDDGACKATGRDRMGTAESSTSVGAIGWYELPFDDWAQTCYDAGKPHSLWFQRQSSTGGNNFRSREGGTNELYFQVYTIRQAAAEVLIRDKSYRLWEVIRCIDGF